MVASDVQRSQSRTLDARWPGRSAPVRAHISQYHLSHLVDAFLSVGDLRSYRWGRSRTMTNHRFPPELVDKFFVHVAENGDLATLKAASLVCSTWRTISCPHRFRRVVVTNQAALEGLEVIHLRPLEVLGPSPWVADVPARLTPLLVHLRTIELVELHEYETQLDAGFIAHLAEFASVDGLSFRGCSMAPAVLHALISALPALCAASVSSTIAQHGGPGPALPQLRSLALESLEVRPTPSYLGGVDMILPWLATTPTAQSLRTLKLTVRLQDAAEVGRFVLLVGARLEELEFELETFLGLRTETAIKQLIPIGHCRKLRAFAVHDAKTVSPAVLGFLNELDSPCLEIISLTVTRSVADPGDLPDLSQFAESLGQLSPSSVKEVRIAYSGLLAIEVAQARIQMALAAVHARGHLVVSRA